MPGDELTILSKQLDEQNQYARTNIQLLVQWFIFFATANYVVLAYFALKLIDTRFSFAIAFYWTAASFGAVNILAFILCLIARHVFAAAEKTINRVNVRLWGSAGFARETQERVPVSKYQMVAILMAITIAVMFSTWAGLVYSVVHASTK